MIDPGVGYRLLEVGETLLETDQVFSTYHNDWQLTEWPGDKITDNYSCYRRKVKEVQEPPKDTVKDLQSKLDQANGIILDLLDGTKYTDEIQWDTGCTIDRCKEILGYYQELLKARG